MSSDNDKLIDERLRTAWRSATRERTPPNLDSEILTQAAAAADRPAQRTWMQPVAYAATILLGVFIVFNVPSPRHTGDDARPAAASEPTAVDAGTRKPGIHETTAPRPAAAAPDPQAKREPPGDETPSIETDAADRESARQRFERSADDVASALESYAATAPSSLGAGRSTTAARADAGDRSACDDARRMSPEAWWRCADSLRNSGDLEAARRELEALYLLHPDFRPPD